MVSRQMGTTCTLEMGKAASLFGIGRQAPARIVKHLPATYTACSATPPRLPRPLAPMTVFQDLPHHQMPRRGLHWRRVAPTGVQQSCYLLLGRHHQVLGLGGMAHAPHPCLGGGEDGAEGRGGNRVALPPRIIIHGADRCHLVLLLCRWGCSLRVVLRCPPLLTAFVTCRCCCVVRRGHTIIVVGCCSFLLPRRINSSSSSAAAVRPTTTTTPRRAHCACSRNEGNEQQR